MSTSKEVFRPFRVTQPYKLILCPHCEPGEGGTNPEFKDLMDFRLVHVSHSASDRVVDTYGLMANPCREG